MPPQRIVWSSIAIALVAAVPAAAETLRSEVAFNNAIGEPTANQPVGGIEVAYQIELQGGDLDGCTVDVVEALHPREEGAWGIFDIEGEVNCTGGGFAYTSSGAWDSNGFHAAGDIKDGSGSGDFAGISGRVAQLGGGASGADDDTLDISYTLVFATGE
jgi:hypothetical protein